MSSCFPLSIQRQERYTESLAGEGKCCIHKSNVEKLQHCARKLFNKIKVQLCQGCHCLPYHCLGRVTCPSQSPLNTDLTLCNDCNYHLGLRGALSVPLTYLRHILKIVNYL